MRILIVHSYYYPYVVGGAEYSVKKLAEQLVKAGNEVFVLCSNDVDTTEIINGVTVLRRKMKAPFWGNDLSGVSKIKIVRNILLEPGNRKNKKVIKSVIQKIKPDVVQTNCLYYITPIAWKVSSLLKVPVVHTIRDYNFLCIKGSLFCNHRSSGCKKPLLFCRLRRSIFRRYSKYVNYVTSPSASSLKTYLNERFFVNAKNVVIENATDFDINQVKKNIEMHSLRKEKTNVVYLGGLTEFKGVGLLLDSIESVENKSLKIYFAGRGALEERIKALSLKDSRVCACGFLNDEETKNLLMKADILVCPSIWEEPFGRVVLDAYVAGIPVIVSNRGALPELILEGKTGFSFDPDNPEQLVNLLSTFPERIEMLDLRRNICELLPRFSIETQGKRFMDVYKNVLREYNKEH